MEGWRWKSRIAAENGHEDPIKGHDEGVVLYCVEEGIV